MSPNDLLHSMSLFDLQNKKIKIAYAITFCQHIFMLPLETLSPPSTGKIGRRQCILLQLFYEAKPQRRKQ